MSLNGNDLTIGSNQISFDDTSIEVQRDDTININADGSLDFKVLANILRALSGSQIQTDTINETTTDAGVTIDELLIKDGNVTPSGLTAGRVVFVDSDGTLTDDSDMTFSDETLTVTKIGAFEAAGAINFANQNMANVDIDSGTVDGITSLTVANDIDIGNYNIRALSGTFDSLTSGRIPIASTNGLLTDDSDLTFSGDTLTATKMNTTELTLDLKQDYKMGAVTAAGFTGYLSIQNQVSGGNPILAMFGKDGDATDYVGFITIGKGLPTDLTNRERGVFWYNAATTQYELYTEADGTGTLRPLVLYTEGNTDQLKLNTDGSVSINAGDLQLDTNNKLQLRDNALHISSQADSYIDYVADGAHRFSGAVTIEHNSAPLGLIRTTTGTNIDYETLTLLAKTSGDMTDNFGTRITFQIDDDNSVVTNIAYIYATRKDADNSGRLHFSTFNTGSEQLALTLNSDKSAVFGAGATFAGDVNPDGDGTRDLGTQNTAQWANVWSDLINGAEFTMMNKMRIMESELYEDYPTGFALGFSDKWVDGVSIWHSENREQYMRGETPIFVVTEEWMEYKGYRYNPEHFVPRDEVESMVEEKVSQKLKELGLV